MNIIRKYGAVVPVLAVLCILPIVTKNTYYLTLYNLALVNAIIVMGLNFITGLTGQMNLATGGIMALGAYGSALLMTKLNCSPLVWHPVRAGAGRG